MSATFRLMRTWFMATPLTRGGTVVGLGLFVAGTAGYLFAPEWSLAYDARREYAVIESVVLSLPWLGLVLLLSASALMPLIVERTALGRSVWLWPRARVALLASVVLTAALLALLTATAATLAMMSFARTFASAAATPPAATAVAGALFFDEAFLRIFYRTLFMAFVDIGLIYMAIWLVSKTGGVWRLAGLLWVVVSITLPLRYVGGIPRLSMLEAVGLASWVAFAVVVLAGGRSRHALSGWRTRAAALARRALPTANYAPGRETALLLGTNRPWLVAVGQVVPIALVALLIDEQQPWLLYLIVFSALAGAMTSRAGAQSRLLWLRYGWTRAEIARRVEAAWLAHNAWSLAVLLVLYAAIAGWLGVTFEALLHGLALLVIGCAVCTWLGLLITRGLGWFETVIAIVTMALLILAAIAIIRGEYFVAFELELTLAVLAVTLRFLARSRWLELDWMRCRLVAPVRGAS